MDTCPICNCLLKSGENCIICGYKINKNYIEDSSENYSSVFDIFDFIDRKES